MSSISAPMDTTDNGCKYRNNKDVMESRAIARPGTIFERFWESIWIEMTIIANYKMGYTLLKNKIQSSPKLDMTRKRSGQVCVLTGAGRGIGFEVLKILLQLDYTVVLGVRNIAAMQKGIEAIRQTGISTGHVKILQLDLKSLASVRNFAELVLSTKEAERIDLLINHAGTYQDRYELTEDNIECHFQVNYLSHFLLTNLLLPRIKNTAQQKSGNISCHIISTSSASNCAASLALDDLVERRVYVPIKCYSDSKLCQIMHAKTMQRHLETEGVANVQMYTIHPGDIATEMWHEFGIRELLLRPFLKAILRTPTDAANAILYPALTDSLSEGCGGKYFDLHRIGTPCAQAEDVQLQERLWDFSVNLTKGGFTI